MAQPLVRSSSVATAAASTTVAVTEPAGAASGDLCIVYVVSDHGAGTDASPGGWTPFEAQTGGAFSRRRWYRELDGGESWPISFQVAGTGSSMIGIAVVLNPNGGSGWSIDDDGSGRATGSGTTATPPSVTALASSLYLTGYGNDSSYTVATPPAGMDQEEYDNTGGISLGVFSEQVGAGALQKALVFSGSDDWDAWGVAISIGGGAAHLLLGNDYRLPAQL